MTSKHTHAAPEVNGRHFLDGKWVEGNPLLMAAWSHAIWMGAAVFDGARAFEEAAVAAGRVIGRVEGRIGASAVSRCRC